MENFPDRNVPFSVLKVTAYPVDNRLFEKIADSCDEILVLEEGYPIVEELMRGILPGGKPIRGRLDGTVPREGELNPNIVARALGMKSETGGEVPAVVKMRPPSFCKGCGHADVYNALNEAMSEYSPGRVFSDIGCYTLGALPPYNAQ
jgi:indolepyruvate ferredoxin oxidoreductase alpha subunit